jgi:hypothetical protein
MRRETRNGGLLGLASDAVVDVVDVAPHRSVLIRDATVERLLNLVDVVVHIIEASVERVLVALLCGKPRLHEEVDATCRGDEKSDGDGEGNVVHLFVLTFLCVYCIRFVRVVKRVERSPRVLFWLSRMLRRRTRHAPRQTSVRNRGQRSKRSATAPAPRSA